MNDCKVLVYEVNNNACPCVPEYRGMGNIKQSGDYVYLVDDDENIIVAMTKEDIASRLWKFKICCTNIV